MPDAPKPPPVDLQQAALDPGSVFDSPESPLSHVGLSARQKAEILRRWQYDAAEIGVATEEGMPGGENNLLQRILFALEKLPVEVDLEQVGPTKQHGVPKSAVRPK